MEANTGILKDLASREAALTLRVEAAKAEALKVIAEAEVKAKEAFTKAQSDASALEAEYRTRRESEAESILKGGMSAARATADAARAAAQSKIADAVKVIVAKVLP